MSHVRDLEAKQSLVMCSTMRAMETLAQPTHPSTRNPPPPRQVGSIHVFRTSSKPTTPHGLSKSSIFDFLVSRGNGAVEVGFRLQPPLKLQIENRRPAQAVKAAGLDQGRHGICVGPRLWGNLVTTA